MLLDSLALGKKKVKKGWQIEKCAIFQKREKEETKCSDSFHRKIILQRASTIINSKRLDMAT